MGVFCLQILYGFPQPSVLVVTWPCLYLTLHLPPISPTFTAFQPYWLSFCPSNMLSFLVTQGLCCFCFFFWGFFHPRSLNGYFFRNSDVWTQLLLPQRGLSSLLLAEQVFHHPSITLSYFIFFITLILKIILFINLCVYFITPSILVINCCMISYSNLKQQQTLIISHSFYDLGIWE